VSIFSGTNAVCVIDSSNNLECYSDKINTNQSNVAQVAIGTKHICSLDLATHVSCWGSNAESQLDIPDSFSSNVLQIAAFDYLTCAITYSGTFGCWGNYPYYAWLYKSGNQVNSIPNVTQPMISFILDKPLSITCAN